MKNFPAQIIKTSVISSILLLSVTNISFAQTTTPAEIEATTTSQTPSGKTRPEVKSMMKDKISTERQLKKEAFMEKLALIKDTKKKALVEKIDTKLSDVNLKRTTQMSEALMKMNTILTNLSSKSALAKEQGQDTSTLNTAIATAKAAIKSAESAVSTQAGKEYTATITTESALRTTVGSTVKTLQTELKSTHSLVAAAKQKTMLAVKELAKLNGKSTDKDASNSAEEN